MPGATRRKMLKEPFLGESIEKRATSNPDRSIALIWEISSGPKNVMKGEFVGSLLGEGSWAIIVAIIVVVLLCEVIW